MKRSLALVLLAVGSFALTACETHVVGRRPGYYSDRPYYNRSQVVVNRGYDDYEPGYRRSYYGGGPYVGRSYGGSYYGGSPYVGRSHSRSYYGGSPYAGGNYIASSPRYSKTKTVYYTDNRGRYYVRSGKRVYVR